MSSIDRYLRQSFLGQNSGRILEQAVVGIVGVGGGGSHIAQQLAHLGVKHLRLIDPDCVEFSNLNRLIGAHFEDAQLGEYKTTVVERLIHGIDPKIQVTSVSAKWE